MTGIIEYIQSNNLGLLTHLRFYNFEEPKCPCICNEGETIRFAGWLAPKNKATISLVVFLNNKQISCYSLNTKRMDVISAYNLEDTNQTNGFDYCITIKNNIKISILINDIIYDLWQFKNSSQNNEFKIIEFLGPSGVGKSTLLGRLTPYLKNGWGINYAYLEVTEPFHESNDLKNLYKTLIYHKAKELIKTQNIFNIPQLLSHYSIRAQRDFWMVSASNGEMRYISDEGLFHLYINEVKELVIGDTLHLPAMQQILNKRMIFNCLQDSKKIIDNLRQRALEIPGAVHDQIGQHGIDSAVKQIESYYLNSSYVIDFIRHLGGRVVDINFEKPIENIVTDIITELRLDELNKQGI